MAELDGNLGWRDRWSVVACMLVVGVAGMAAVWLTGRLAGARGSEAVRYGALLVAWHVAASLVAGAVAGMRCGPGVAVGMHLGLYNLGTPLAVWARVRWLCRVRRGFLREGFLRVFAAVYCIVVGVMLVMIAVWKR